MRAHDDHHRRAGVHHPADAQLEIDPGSAGRRGLSDAVWRLVDRSGITPNAVTVVGRGHIHDELMAERLWRVSQDLTAEYLVTHTGPDWNDYERAARDQARPATRED